MTERERLIELLMQGAFNCSRGKWRAVFIADFLLANGVRVPPVNENDTVYIILLNKVIPLNVIRINLYQKQFFYQGLHGLHLTYTFKTDDIGKTVFLTREEAENALKECDENA